MKVLPIKLSSIFFKLAIVFLLIMLPLSILGLYLNYSSSTTVKEQIEQSLKSRLHNYVRGMDADFQRMLRLRNELLADSDLQTLSYAKHHLSDYLYAQAVLRIQEKLRLLQASSLYMADISVYLPRIQRNISSRGFIALPVEDEIAALKQSTLSSPIVFWNNQYVIGGSYPGTYGIEDSDDEPFLILKLSVSEDFLQQSLDEVHNTKRGGGMLLQADKQWKIVSGNDQMQALAERLIPHIASESMEQFQNGSFSVTADHVAYTVIYEKSSVLNTVMAVFLPEAETLGPLTKYRYWYWIITLTSVVIVIIFSYWIYRIIHQPIQRMVVAFRKLEKGNLNVSLKHSQEDEFAYLYEQFNMMSSKLQLLVHEVYEEKIRSQQSELKQLQSQINPHFLYNSYFVLHRVAQMHDTDTVIRLSRHLGEYFRYITRNGADEIALAQEIRHTHSYMEIQMLRYSRRIQTICEELPDSCKEVLVPRLVLQPILENAYEHGLENKMAGGIVKMSFSSTDELLQITVEDNGDDLSDRQIEIIAMELKLEEHVETTGMLNVHRRLQLKFGKKYGLSVSRSSLGGLCVEAAIPITKGT